MNLLDCQLLYEQLQSLFHHFSRTTLLTAEGQTLFLKYEAVSDIGTLPQSAEVSHKYLNLQDGDIVLTNDPYSGGTVISSPTLVMGVGTRQLKGTVPAEFLIASRLTFSPQVGAFKTVDEEGLRIPPSPLYMRGEMNIPIIEALRNHPQALPQFIERVQAAAGMLLDLRGKLKSRLSKGTLDLSRATVKSYLQQSEKMFVRRMEELGHGAASSEMDLSDNEMIRLKAEHLDGQFRFDFTGTTSGHSVFMTDWTTIGTTIGTTLAWMKEDIPINSGVFSRFDINVPRGSLLNSAFPRPVYLGHTDGVNFVANVVGRALAGIDRKRAWASSGHSHVSYEITFSDKRRFVDSLPVGAGASPKRRGMDGVNLWRRLSCQPSIEMIEEQFPLQFINVGFRSNSEGDGTQLGGRGVVRSLKILDAATLSWAHISPPHKPEGLEGGKSAHGPEMVLLKTTGEKIELATTGQMQLQRGDVLTVLSPGGGGYGAKS